MGSRGAIWNKLTSFPSRVSLNSTKPRQPVVFYTFCGLTALGLYPAVYVSPYCLMMIIIKRQLKRRSNMAIVYTRAPYNVRCSYSAKQLVSEVRTREKMCIEQVFVIVVRTVSENTNSVSRGTSRLNSTHKLMKPYRLLRCCSQLWR